MKAYTFDFLKKQLESIIQLVKDDKATTENLERNWDKDREDFTEFKNRLEHFELELKSLKETVAKIPQHTQDRVAEVAQPIMESADNLNSAIFRKKMVTVNPQLINGHNRNAFQKFGHWWIAGWE
jgi:hypothetical protein